MKWIPRVAMLSFVAFAASLLAAQRGRIQGFGGGFGDYGSYAKESHQPTEFSWSRLRYDSARYGGYRSFRGNWSTDYPKADRQFLVALRRLTRIEARSTEQVVDLNPHPEDPTQDISNFPWVYAVQVQAWTFTADQAKRLRDYLYKGGFLMVDDFHGEADWQSFLANMRLVLPNEQIEELKDDDPIFHTIYDLDHRFQVPGEQYVNSGRTYEKDGIEPHWRAIRDDKGRVMVAIIFNQHLGDAWEWADDPRYPENFASLAFRLGINYIMYGMTR